MMNETPIASTESQLDPEKQKQAKRLTRIRRRLSIIDILLSVAVALALIFSGASGSFIALLRLPVVPAVVVYIAVLMVGSRLLFSPLDYYGEFVLGHRFGLSVETFRGWLLDELKSTGLGLVMGGAVVALLYELILISPSWWWIIAWAVMILISVILSNLAPVILVPLFYKMKLLDDPELRERLAKLLEKTKTKVGGIYLIEFSRKSTTANAALMGLGNTRRIVLSDTLLNKYTPEEIETIAAHEIGHYKHRDTMRLLFTQSLSLFVVFLVGFLAFRAAAVALGFKGMSDPAAFPLLALVFGAITFIIMPLRNAFGRYIETQADEYSLELTDNPESFNSAMARLTDQNLAESESPRWVEVLLHDHPSYKQRAAHAKEFQIRKTK